jgi:galactose oxidase-like protein
MSPVAPPPPNVTLTVTPTSLLTAVNDTWTLQAKVQGASNQGVTWTIEEGSRGGSITTGGSYTAPATTGTYHVVATSVANPAVAATVPVTAVAHGFFVVGETHARSENTATLLGNGDVLLVGGHPTDGSGVTISGCQGQLFLTGSTLFSSTTSTFIDGAGIFPPRDSLTATLLLNEKVLIAGGFAPLCGPPALIAELFDPNTGMFAYTGAIANDRSGHTATLLVSGKVLLVGGGNNGVAELYDPATGIFSPTGSLSTDRSFPTATLISGDRVLIAGGYASCIGSTNGPVCTIASTAEIYDPIMQTFTDTAPLARAGHTATLLPDGTVLMAGGFDQSGNALDTLVRFDPSTQIFNPAGKMTTPRAGHTATLLPSGLVLITGGYVPNGPPALASAELYDPATQNSTPVAPLHVARTGHHATLLLDGRVLITDGSVGTAEVFK